ncbi:MAG TPA: (2Fe-2S)-binding protein [Stellaceae bacterium]|jgi:bacterioferritin-associated ferredoxin|nr:(2Fe-2S)-binding protein [Stellaceae bacterium]
MYVCVCNAITDRDVCAKAEHECSTVSAIYRSLGTKPKCGKCVPLVRQLMRQVVELPHAEPAVAAVG